MDRVLQKDPVEMAYSFASKFPGVRAASHNAFPDGDVIL